MVPLADFRGGLSGDERDVLFVNPGAGPFVEAGYVRGIDLPHDGRAVVPFDPDGDGDLDLAILSLQDLRLLENRTPGARHFVRLRLTAKGLDRAALGAVVRVTAGDRTVVQRVDRVRGFHSQIGPDVHVGLGAASRVSAVEVAWPSGLRQRWADLPADGRLLLREGEPAAQVEPLAAWPAATRPTPRVAYDPAAPVTTTDGAVEPVAPRGRPTLVNVWAPSCRACADELIALSALHLAHGEALRVVGVSAEVDDPAAVEAYATRAGLTFPVRLATDAFIRAFFGDGGEVPLPTTFVFDAEGQLRRTIRRPLGRAELDALVRTLVVAPPPRTLFLEAMTQLRGGDPKGACARVTAGLRDHPDDVLSLREQAEICSSGGDTTTALASLRRANALAPKDAAVWADVARIHLAAGDPNAAHAAVVRALALDARHPRALIVAAEEAIAGQRRDEAAAYLRVAIEVDPKDAYARRLMGQVQGPP